MIMWLRRGSPARVAVLCNRHDFPAVAIYMIDGPQNLGAASPPLARPNNKAYPGITPHCQLNHGRSDDRPHSNYGSRQSYAGSGVACPMPISQGSRYETRGYSHVPPKARPCAVAPRNVGSPTDSVPPTRTKIGETRTLMRR
jgi:hypothetical protein